MAERYDAVILGMGSGGELAAGKLLSGGKSVAVVEKELIGGECAYWACIPSKTLLRPPEIRGEARKAFGTGTPTLELKEIFDHRDWMIRNLDDSGQVEGFEGKGATVIKGEGRITGPGEVEANGQTPGTDDIIVATEPAASSTGWCSGACGTPAVGSPTSSPVVLGSPLIASLREVLDEDRSR